MDCFNHAKTCLMLPMEREDEAVLLELVQRLAPHRGDLAENWRKAFAGSPARASTMGEDFVAEMAKEMIDALIGLAEEGEFIHYFETMRRLGQKYVNQGVPYSSLLFAVHLYEETNLPIVAREYTSVDTLQKVLLAQDHLFHNVLALFAAAYFERALDELTASNQEMARLMRALEARTAELEEAERRRQEFVSMIVHEFRGPLTVIGGFAQLQAGAASKGETCDLRVLDTIRSQVKRLERLVADLSDVSLLDSDQMRMVPAECDLVAVARKTVEEQQITTTGHALVLEADPDEIVGEWDGERIAQAIGNLVGNAIKYSPNGGEVRVSVSLVDGEARVSVSDQGIGVAALEISNLFEPFSRVYRERTVKGTGLGLYITKGIVHSHGGRVWVESEEGAGSTFHFALPIRSAREVARAQCAPSPQ